MVGMNADIVRHPQLPPLAHVLRIATHCGQIQNVLQDKSKSRLIPIGFIRNHASIANQPRMLKHAARRIVYLIRFLLKV